MINTSALFPGGGDNFTFVGNVAPPRPTTPQAAILSIISFAPRLIFLTVASVRSIDSSHSSPSTIITTALHGLPARSFMISIDFTVPETEECTGAEIKPEGLAIN
jgi:hypothetical protein